MKENKENTFEELMEKEGRRISKSVFAFKDASSDFKESLKARILEERNKEPLFRRVFETLTVPLQPKYSFSAIALMLVLFFGVNLAYLPEEGDGIVYTGLTRIKDALETEQKDKADDWQLAMEEGLEYSLPTMGGARGSSKSYSLSSPQAESDMGFAVGGAQDINNFRENINNNYLPLPADITYEGLFYDYYFDTAQQEECNELFCPSYSYAVAEDPFSGEEEHFLSVGLNSNLDASEFERKKLNLVVVLDISGSMGAGFNSYYYDRFGNKIEAGEDSGKTKMQIANESIVSLLGHLNDDDRFGMVVFNNEAFLAKPLNLVGDIDIDAIKEHVLDLRQNGGTNMAAGMQKGTELFDDLLNVDQSDYENRIIFLTDAMPNTGEISENGLLGITKGNAENKLHSTFIGIGVDFNTELVEHITKIRGANYYSVHSSEEFEKRMDDEFEYMVTPLVFDLNLILEVSGFEIEKVYGSPEADEATGELMKVNTLFPSKVKEGETRGGLILLKLKKIGGNPSLKLKVTYEDRSSNPGKSESAVDLADKSFKSTGIRKGVLLSRYASLMKNWINDERAKEQDAYHAPCLTRETGLIEPCPIYLGKWERQSVALNVSEHYEGLFEEFKSYFGQEMDKIGDDSLEREADVLEKLIKY